MRKLIEKQQADKIALRIAFTRDNPNKLATDYIPEYADWLELRCIELKELIVKQNKQIYEMSKL
jgi:hypothetical protein